MTRYYGNPGKLVRSDHRKKLNRKLEIIRHGKSLAATIILVVAVLTFGSFSKGAHAQQDGLGIAAVVNDDVISALDLHLRTSMIVSSSNMPDTAETRSRIMPQVLRGLIDEKLMLQEARRVGIKVEQSEIDNGMKRIAESNGMTVVQLSEQLGQIGVPLSALAARIEAEISWQIFVGRTLSRTITVGKEEINDEIKRIEASAGRPEYLLADIYLPVDKPEQDAEVQQLAIRLLEQIQSGAPFNALASNFSRSPSAAQGGDMGWVQASHLDAALLNAISTLQPGNVTRPIRTLGGYYIMLLRDVRTSPGLGHGDATMRLSQYHLMVPAGTAPNTVAMQIQSATSGVTSCAQMDALGLQSGSQLSGSLGEMSLSVLPPDMRGVLENLPVGRVSEPIATGGGMAVLMICERQDQGVDNDAVRAQIADRLTLERLDVVAQRHLRDLRRQAFIDIRL